MPHRSVLMLGLAALLCASSGRDGLDDLRRAVRLNDAAVVAIERGEFGAAIRGLQKAIKLDPSAEVPRSNLALSHALRGRESLAAGRRPAALRDFKDAQRLVPDEPVFVLDEAWLRFQWGERSAARRLLEEVLRRRPLAPAEELLGQVEYLDDRLPEAIAALERALAIQPDRAGSAHLLAKVRREYEHEADFVVWTGSRFEVKYHPRSNGSRRLLEVRRVLDRAYVRVCGELGGHPREEVPVVLYDPEVFPAATEADRWIGGLYDGRIRLPISAEGELDDLERLLCHEFSHCVIDQSWPSAPTWFHEGLAQCIEPDATSPHSRLARIAGDQDPPSAASLPPRFVGLRDRNEVELCYLVSFSFVWFLREHYGSGPLRQVLRRAKHGKDVESILGDAYPRKLPELEAQWRRAVRSAR